MGNTYEVWSWVMYTILNDSGEKSASPHYEAAYAGESLFAAFRAMRREKKKGIGCVKFYWR